MSSETIPAYYQHPRPPGTTVQLIVLHDPGVAGDTDAVIRGSAQYCALPETKRQPPSQGGYHRLAGPSLLVLAARDSQVVYGAAGTRGEMNTAGWHLCMGQHAGIATLTNAARETAAACKRLGIPPGRVEAAQIGKGVRGIASHADVAVALGGDHTDPIDFDWPRFLNLVHGFYNPVPAPAEGAVLTTVATGQTQANGRTPSARPVPALGVVLLDNGARMKGDKASGAAHTWRDPSVPASARLIDISPSCGSDGKPDGQGVIAYYDLGNNQVGTYRGYWL
jgi:hypothetical protein